LKLNLLVNSFPKQLLKMPKKNIKNRIILIFI
jgi:hypothetical protein